MIDLHTHSIFSDGSLTPEELVAEAVRLPLTAIALTDHDTTAGLARFAAAGAAAGLRTVPGVELSVDFSPGAMHLLGYFIDPANEALERRLRWMREGRVVRNAEILRKLQGLGFALGAGEVAAFAQEEVVGRPHFAQALIARGYVANKDEAFRKYLAKGRPAYAERLHLPLAEALGLIRAAGGVPVLAHPFTLDLSPRRLAIALHEWRVLGLAGIEAFYAEHNPVQTQTLLRLATEVDLVATGGSDFHGALAPDIRLGTGFGALRVPDDVLGRLEARRG